MLGKIIAIIIPLSLWLVLFRPTQLGGDVSYLTITSGSMEPSIHLGSVIMVEPSDTIEKGDIITFKIPGSDKIATHRIYEKLENGIKTKGDAVEDPDPWVVSSEEIIGRVKFSIPYLGYIIRFITSLPGVIIFVTIPTILLITREIGKIRKTLKYGREEEKF